MPKVVAGYKEEAKSRIIEAALDVFTKQGFDRSTMDEVAHRVGVSKAALYRYFPSKDSLLEAVFIATQRRLQDFLSESFEGKSLEDGVGKLFDRLDRTYGQSYDLILEWFAQAYRDVRIRKLMKADGERDIETVAAFLRDQRRKGRLRSRENPRMLAQLFETAFTGAWVRIAMGHDRQSVVRSIEFLISLVEHRR